MLGGLWHRLTREPISRRNLTAPVRTLRAASQKVSVVFVEVTPLQAARLAQSWCSFWNTSPWGGRKIAPAESAELEREWIHCADIILLAAVRASIADAVVFNTAIAKGMQDVQRLTPQSIAKAGSAAMEGGSVLFWSDLSGLLLVVVGAPS